MALYLTSRLETNALIQASATDAVRLSVRRADLVGMGCERHPFSFLVPQGSRCSRSVSSLASAASCCMSGTTCEQMLSVIATDECPCDPLPSAGWSKLALLGCLVSQETGPDYKTDYILAGRSWTTLDDASPKSANFWANWTTLDESGQRA
jgi:hypothetical protein